MTNYNTIKTNNNTTTDIEMNISSSLPSSLPPSSSSRINNSNSLRFKDGRINEITLIWRKLDKYIDIEGTKTTKQILFNVSGIAKPGEMIALMGKLSSFTFFLSFLSYLLDFTFFLIY